MTTPPDPAVQGADGHSPTIQIAGNVTDSVIIIGDGNEVIHYRDDAPFAADGYLIDATAVHGRLDLERRAPRSWAVERIDRFLESNPCGYIIVEGDAGMGKSTLLSTLALERNYPAHFVELMRDTGDGDAALRNLAVQVMFAFGLEERFAPTGTLRPSSAEVLFNDVVNAAVKVASSRTGPGAGGRVIVVVDGLDLVESRPGQNPLGLPRVLPDGLFVIASSRPGPPLLTSSSRTVVGLVADAASNRDELRAFVEQETRSGPLAAVIDHHDVSPDDFAASVIEASGGVWVVARRLLEEVAAGARAPSDVDSGVGGLWRYYAQTVLPLARAEPRSVRVLALVCAGFQPLSLRVIFEVLASEGFDDIELRQALDLWAGYLTSSPRPDRRYGPYHRSIVEFLAGDSMPEDVGTVERDQVADFSDQLRGMHSMLADRYLDAWGGTADVLPAARGSSATARMDNGYGLDHLVGHLCRAGRADEADALVWIENPTTSRPVWFELKAGHLGLSAFRRDLDRIIDELGTAAAASGSRLGLCWMHGSLNSYLARLPSSALPGLVASGVLSLDEAWANIERVPAGNARAEGLISLAAATAERRAELEQAVLDTLYRVEDDYWRLSELIRFDRVRQEIDDASIQGVVETLSVDNQELASLLLHREDSEPADAGPPRNQPEFVDAYLQRNEFAESLVAGWLGQTTMDERRLGPSAGRNWLDIARGLRAVATGDEPVDGSGELDPRSITIGDLPDHIWVAFGRVVDWSTFAETWPNAALVVPETGEAIWRLVNVACRPRPGDQVRPTPTGDEIAAVFSDVLTMLARFDQPAVLAVIDTAALDIARLPVDKAAAVVEIVGDQRIRATLWNEIFAESVRRSGGPDWINAASEAAATDRDLGSDRWPEQFEEGSVDTDREPAWSRTARLGRTAGGDAAEDPDLAIDPLLDGMSNLDTSDRDHLLVELGAWRAGSGDLVGGLELVDQIDSIDLATRALSLIIDGCETDDAADLLRDRVEALSSSNARGQLFLELAAASDAGHDVEGLVDVAVAELAHWNRSELADALPLTVEALQRLETTEDVVLDLAARVASLYRWWP